MATAMVWRTSAFGDFRVTVEKVSVNGMAALVRFTRSARYLPAEAGSDATMWVTTSTLHKVASKAAESAAESAAKRTAETRKGKMPQPTKTKLAPEFTSF